MQRICLVQASGILQDAIQRLRSVLCEGVELIVDICAQRIQIGTQICRVLANDCCGLGRNILGSNVG